MLCVNNYSQQYIDNCRSKFAAQVAAYQGLVAAARKQVAVGEPQLDAVIQAFEAHFFRNLVLALDSHFVHRARAKEMKNGNPLNEVRMLCNAMMNNNNVMCADKTIKYDPTRSVLKCRVGDEVKLSQSDYMRLSAAFFAEMEHKYL